MYMCALVRVMFVDLSLYVTTGSSREVETTVLNPASQFLSNISGRV